MKTELVEIFIAQDLLQWNLHLHFSGTAQNKYFDILALILEGQDQQNALPSPLLREQQMSMWVKEG